MKAIIWAATWENRIFAYAKTKTQISFAVTAKLISAFVFATLIGQSLFYLNTKFQASSHFLRRRSLICVGPGRKPRRPVFWRRGSYKVASAFKPWLGQEACSEHAGESILRFCEFQTDRHIKIGMIKWRSCRESYHVQKRYLDSTIPLLAKSKISSFWPSPVAVQPGLCQTWSESTLLVFLCWGSC